MWRAAASSPPTRHAGDPSRIADLATPPVDTLHVSMHLDALAQRRLDEVLSLLRRCALAMIELMAVFIGGVQRLRVDVRGCG